MDAAKDIVLDFLYELQRKYPKHPTGFPKAYIIIKIRRGNRNISEADLGLAIDYLEDEKYLKAQSIKRVKYYRLSSKALDKILTPSMYSSKRSTPQLRILNNGILVMGDNYGSISIKDRQEAMSALDMLTEIVSTSPQLEEKEKVDIIESATTLSSQLRREQPDKSIVKKAWSIVSQISNLEGATSLVHKVSLLLNSIIS